MKPPPTVILRIFLVAVVIFCGISLLHVAADAAERINARGLVVSTL